VEWKRRRGWLWLSTEAWQQRCLFLRLIFGTEKPRIALDFIFVGQPAKVSADQDMPKICGEK
jgi:hypothetical protein